MPKWEYLTTITHRKHGDFGIDQFKPDIELNNWGEKGWELIAVIPVADTWGNSSGSTDDLVYYLKRQKE